MGATMTAITSPLPAAAVEENIPCLRCGYNLRTLASDSRCPECSTSIASSLDPNLLRCADPSWTSILALSLALLLVAGAIEVAEVILYAMVEQFEAAAAGNLLSLTPTEFAHPLFWIAAFILGAPDPGAPARRISLRRVLRVSAVLTLISALLPVIDFFDFTELPIEGFLGFVTTTLIFCYLLQLARRTDSRRLVLFARISIVVVIICACFWLVDLLSYQDWMTPERFEIWGPALWLIASSYIWLLFVLFIFRRALLKSAAFARQYWHFCSPLP
jgi:hypothetical protein